jgi:hypothetical protein
MTGFDSGFSADWLFFAAGSEFRSADLFSLFICDCSCLLDFFAISDDPHTWQNYVDSLVTKTDPTIKPEKEVRLIPQ